MLGRTHGDQRISPLDERLPYEVNMIGGEWDQRQTQHVGTVSGFSGFSEP